MFKAVLERRLVEQRTTKGYSCNSSSMYIEVLCKRKLLLQMICLSSSSLITVGYPNKLALTYVYYVYIKPRIYKTTKYKRTYLTDSENNTKYTRNERTKLLCVLAFGLGSATIMTK